MPDSLIQKVCRAADLLSCAWDAAAFENEDTLTQCVPVAVAISPLRSALEHCRHSLSQEALSNAIEGSRRSIDELCYFFLTENAAN